MLDEYLDKQKHKFASVHEVMDTGSSREWARPPRAPAAGGSLAATAEEEADEGDSSDGSIYDHPFFDGLKEKPKEEQWDAETILSTYTTTDNHPTTMRMARKPRRGDAAITIDKRTGLPVGTMLPAEEERRRLAEAAGGDGSDDEAEGYGRSSGVNTGAARPKAEGAEEKRERKAAARAVKAERRQEKKGTKVAFQEERVAQVQLKMKTASLPATSLSRWGS